jgi:hypothetical protein
MMPKIYTAVKNKLTKKFIHTAMVARLVKTDLMKKIGEMREKDEVERIPQVI